jgi:hypothetical protein
MVVTTDRPIEDMLQGDENKFEQDETQKDRMGVPEGRDRAIAQYSVGSLYNITNQSGVKRPFSEDPHVRPFTMGTAMPELLRTTRQPVPDFWTYDGAQPTIGAQGKTATSRYQMLPHKKVTEQQAVEWNRIGSKKGWQFNSRQAGPGGVGERKPTFTSDGFPKTIEQNRWFPVPRSEENQHRAVRLMPAIDIENNSRGIGLTGPGAGNGGMAGGYKEINQSRLAALPIPAEKFNWTGTRLVGTGRENEGIGAGAGGFRAGYKSQYPDRPSFPERRTMGLSRVTQNAA